MTDSLASKKITILQLYPNEMNIYGDRGNVLTLMRRLEWHGYAPEVIYYDPGKPFPRDVDIIVGGGRPGLRPREGPGRLATYQR